MLKNITSTEKLVYKKTAVWLISNYKAIRLMDPEPVHTFQNSTNFIQGFVYRCLKSSSKEILDINYDWSGLGVHKYITPTALHKYETKQKTLFIRNT